MLFLIVQLSFFLVVPWAFWRLIRRRLFPTVLDNIPGPKASSWTVGCLNDLVNTKAWDYHKKIAETYGGVIRIKGIFGANDLYVFDPQALHHILVKDQYIYEETDSFVEASKLLFGKGILASVGEEHRRQRKMLNPVFSISHIREMMPTFYEVANKVRRAFLRKVEEGPQEVDVMGWMSRIALEIIGQSGLGYSFDELTESSIPHAYGLASKQLVPMQGKSNLLLINFALLPISTKIGTPAFRRFIVDLIPFKDFRKLRDIVDTLQKTSVEIWNSKKKAIQEGDEAVAAQIGRGKDLISILMKANIEASEDEKLSDEELLGQISTLTSAATDNTAAALSRTLHLLAEHKDIQNNIREEIRKARQETNGQELSYEDLISLPYLDAVCRETLRLYPSASLTMRGVREDIILPIATPIKGINGEEIHEIPLPRGTKIYISMLQANRNPELWGPDAEEWKPERWLNPLPDSLINARVPGVYSHLMTFSGGGRSCIGFKFFQLEMKVVLALLLESLVFSLSEKEIFWQMTGIVTPNLDPDSVNPTLPMIINRAK